MAKKATKNSAMRRLGKRYGFDKMGPMSLWDTNEMPQMLIDKLCADLLKKAAERKDLTSMTQYFKEMGILPTTFKNWCKKYPQIETAYRNAMEFIGDTREKHGMENGLSPALIKYSMQIYKEEYKKLADDDRNSGISSNGASSVSVVMAQIPSVDSVPTMEEDK